MRPVGSNVDGMQGLSDDIIAHLMAGESRLDRFAYQGVRTMLVRVSATQTHACAKETGTETEGTAYPKLIIVEGETQGR